jgi:2-aminoethylphosphonate-pyruvate transaminase
MTQRMILLNPGPVTLSDRVRAALVRGDWCHREPEFAGLVREINTALAGVYAALAADYQSVLLTGSGTAAVEAMLASLAPDERVTLVLTNGVYGERMAQMLAAHHKPHRVLKYDWTSGPDVAAVDRVLANDPSITHVAAVHHETTTGRLNDVEAIGRVCRTRGTDLLLDCVSSFGAEQIAGQEWNLAAAAATANKCLHGAPGLAFVLGRPDIWASRPARADSVYLDLHAYHRMQHTEGFSPFTHAVQVAFALAEALAEHREQGGWQTRRQAYLRRAARIGETLAALGVETLIPAAESSAVLRAYRLPDGTTYQRLHQELKDQGFVIYAGQGQLAPSIFRVAHMGDVRDDDLTRLCAALTSIIGRRR